MKLIWTIVEPKILESCWKNVVLKSYFIFFCMELLVENEEKLSKNINISGHIILLHFFSHFYPTVEQQGYVIKQFAESFVLLFHTSFFEQLSKIFRSTIIHFRFSFEKNMHPYVFFFRYLVYYKIFFQIGKLWPEGFHIVKPLKRSCGIPSLRLFFLFPQQNHEFWRGFLVLTKWQ